MKQIKNPFPGLRPFQADEAHLFFGRENQVSEIIDILNRGHFVSVVGNSGSGKSSLIRAGILPSLTSDDNWLVVTMRPGSNPVKSLAAALEDSGLSLTVPEGKTAEQVLSSSNRGLLQLCRQLNQEGKKLLLLVDQFEEIFRFQTGRNQFNESDHLAALLVNSIVQNELPIYIMISLRSDFLGDCEQFEGLPQAINKGLFLIPRLNQEEIKTVITGPAKYAGVKISPLLVQKLVSEVGDNPDQLPVLQHALMRTWEAWEKQGEIQKPIDVDAYESTGGINKALSNHAEEAFAELKSDEDRKLAESIFKVVTYKGADNRGVRRPASVDRICRITGAGFDQVVRVLNVFRDENRGFVMPPFNVNLSEQSVIDISHESLMRVWDRLRVWADEEAESSELYGLLSNSALLYEKDKAGLWHDPDLQLALDWKKKNNPTEAWATQYNSHFDKAMRFLNASEQSRRHKQRLATRYRRLVASAMVVAIVALSILSVWAFSERQNSVKSAKQAVAEQKKAQAQKEIAEKQKSLAENNLIKANTQEKLALAQQAEAEKQKNLALLRAEETRLQKLKAERASVEAIDARKAAELDRRIAESQKLISDSLRIKAERSEKNATRLRILSVAQNIAINSRLRASGDSADRIARLMALQAYRFNKEYGGDPGDPNIYEALLFSVKKTKRLSSAHTIANHADAVKAVEFIDDSRFLSAGDDGVIITGDLFNTTAIKKSSPTGLIIGNLAVNDVPGSFFFSGDDNKLYRGESDNLSYKALSGFVHPAKIQSILVSPSGLITGCIDQNVRLIDKTSGVLLKTLKLQGKPISMVLGKNGKIYVGLEGGDIVKLNSDLEQPAEVLIKTNSAQITAIDVSSDGNLLAYGNSDGVCGVIKVQNPGNSPLIYRGHAASVGTVRFQNNGSQMASSSYDGKLIMWSTSSSGSPIVIQASETWIYCHAYNGNGKYLISGSKDKTVKYWSSNAETLFEEVKTATLEWFTKEEWGKHIGSDILYSEP